MTDELYIAINSIESVTFVTFCVSRVELCLAACEVISKPLGLGGQEKVDILSF